MNKRLSLIAALSIVVLLTVGWHFYRGKTVPAGQPALLSLTAQNFDELRKAFNASAGDVRVVLLLSPTCPTCLRGSAAVEHVLKQNSNPHLRVFAIWEAMLPTDYARPGTLVLGRLSDPRVAQYWDKNHLFALELARKLRSDADHPQPGCCTRDGVHWDEIIVYDQDARWDAQLPRAAYVEGPVVDNAPELSEVMARLLSI
jgi:hypothetical protein